MNNGCDKDTFEIESCLCVGMFVRMTRSNYSQPLQKGVRCSTPRCAAELNSSDCLIVPMTQNGACWCRPSRPIARSLRTELGAGRSHDGGHVTKLRIRLFTHASARQCFRGCKRRRCDPRLTPEGGQWSNEFISIPGRNTIEGRNESLNTQSYKSWGRIKIRSST